MNKKVKCCFHANSESKYNICFTGDLPEDFLQVTEPTASVTHWDEKPKTMLTDEKVIFNFLFVLNFGGSCSLSTDLC